MSLSLPMTARRLRAAVPMDKPELERMAEAAFLQWTALHLPRRQWADLADWEQEKYRLMVRAVLGTARVINDERLAG